MPKLNPQTQFSLGEKSNKIVRAHGGSMQIGKRKLARPLDRKKSLHITLKSKSAKGALSLRATPKRIIEIESLIRKKARIFGVKIEHYANVGNHLHLLVRFHNRTLFQNFLRTIAGLISRKILKAERGVSRKKQNLLSRVEQPIGAQIKQPVIQQSKVKKKFWDQLAFTRVVELGRDHFNVVKYVSLNVIEGALGKTAREQCKHQNSG